MNIGWRIKKINDLLEKRANRELQKRDLTFSQHHALMYLMHAPDHTATLKEMEKYFGVAQATMAGIVVRLENKELLYSDTDPDDRRVKVVVLSEKGLEVCRKSKEQVEEDERRMKAEMTEAEQEELSRLLEVIYEHLRKEDISTGNDRRENL